MVMMVGVSIKRVLSIDARFGDTAVRVLCEGCAPRTGVRSMCFFYKILLPLAWLGRLCSLLQVGTMAGVLYAGVPE